MTPHPRTGARALAALLAAAALVLAGSTSIAAALPADRAYELVSPPEANESSPGDAIPSADGSRIDYQGDSFADAHTGAQTLYQATRTADGWQTRALTPKDVTQSQVLAETAEMFLSSDLSQTIFTTAQPLAAGDQDSGALDLYRVSDTGAIDWASQGSQGGTAPWSVTFAGATPDASHVVFTGVESLLTAAIGMEPNGFSSDQYLYDRDLTTGETQLVDVDNEGHLISSEGAILGNGNYTHIGEPPAGDYLPADTYGTTTHAISEDGSKIFFESPAPTIDEPGLNRYPQRDTHLYMRKGGSTTVPLDDPSATENGGARYLGASADGSKVFFMSNEGLAGDEFKDPELYVYDTDAEQLTAISVAPQGSPPVDGIVNGVSAVSNDGSHVYYVAKGKLTTNTNAYGQAAVEGAYNFYVYDTTNGRNTFIAAVGSVEVEPEEGANGQLTSMRDIERPAIPTPNGNVLLFMSKRSLTGEDAGGTAQAYRYEASTEKLQCISCGADGAKPSTIGSFEAIGGGSYDPQGMSAPMDESGDEIFFATQSALVPEDRNSDAPPSVAGIAGYSFEIPNDDDVYEWHNGTVSLISAGQPGFTSLQGVSPSGRDVLLLTSVQLTDQQPNGYIAIYDARLGGGFPSTPTPQASCAPGETCRGPVGAAPAPITPGTALLGGLGEAPLVPTALAPVKVKPPAAKKPAKKKPAKKKAKKKKSKQTKKKAGKRKAKKSQKRARHVR